MQRLTPPFKLTFNPFFKLYFSLLVILLSLSHAQTAPLTLQEALRSAVNRTEVVTAGLELADALAALSRTEGDPAALRPDLVGARLRVALAEAEHEAAYYRALGEIAGAYTGLLEAAQQVALAEGSVALAEQALTIAQIRAERGSATPLDVQDAQVGLESARNSLRAVQEGRALAANSLEGILGRTVDADALQPLPEGALVALPALEDALSAAQAHPDLLRVAQGLELAQMNVDLLDPSYASRSQIDAARTQLSAAEEGFEEAQRGFALAVRNRYLAAQNAAETYQTRLEGVANADARLGQERQRLDSGLIPEIAYNQAEFDNRRARLEALEARHDYLNALLELQAGTLLEIPGLGAREAGSGGSGGQGVRGQGGAGPGASGPSGGN